LEIGVKRAVALALAVVLTSPADVYAVANPAYAGYGTLASHYGVKGYIWQATAPAVQSGSAKAQLSFVAICNASCTKWVQIGQYQGEFTCCTSLATVQTYVENLDPCGEYSAQQYGIPPSPDILYKVKYDFTGSHLLLCQDGSKKTRYDFDFVEDTTTLGLTGFMPSSSGIALAETEIHNGAPITTNYFGCGPTLACNNGGNGLQLEESSNGWWLWTSGFSTGPLHDNPPYLHTFQNYWAFKTCPSSC
jgi:hypothetical protein